MQESESNTNAPVFRKNFFRVEEDSEILEYWKSKKDLKKMNEICSDISLHQNRTSNAVRDRLKRYLVLLSAKDIELIHQAAKVRIRVFWAGLI